MEFRPVTGNGGVVELSLRCGEPESGHVGPEGRKANRWPVDVSSLGAVRRNLYDQYMWRSSLGSPMWVTAGLLANDNYSTPTVNNIYSLSSSFTGIDIQRVLNDVP